MSSGEDGDTCEFGHTFEVNGSPEMTGVHSFKELVKAQKDSSDPYSLLPVLGEPYKNVKVSSGTQGMPYTFILSAADKFDTDLGWNVAKTEEKIFVSPQNTMHQEMVQRKQQAEQNIKTNMQGLEQLRKSKHLLQHDIRKLRSRIEDIRTGDEDVIKGDFVQLVDGAGAGGQGADEQALRFLRDNNIYPTIVSDFNEMKSLEDLKPKDDGGTGKLANLPANEKAILKKKYTMYEKWKDMYGSEIQNKLKDLKKELRRIERAIEETKEWLAPYVRDMVMINQKSQEEIGEDLNRFMTFTGYATMFKQMEFIAYQPLENEEGGLVEVESEDNATHYKLVHMHCVHVNIAGGDNPNSPTKGPTAGIVQWRPAVVCEHVFDNLFRDKINRSQELYEQLMEDYTGEFETDEGEEFKSARVDKGLAIRELREEVGKKIDESPPLDFSSFIRRVEDGFETPESIAEKYSKDYLKAVDNILDTNYATSEESEQSNGARKDFEIAVRKFTGNYDKYYIPDNESPLADLKNEIKFSYYYDLKIGLGLYTMK